MGNSPLTVCICQAWEKQTVQVVLPDGQVLFMPHPLTVAMLMEEHPKHIVCQGSPSLLEQRLPIDQRLESGEIYYLLPTPPQIVATTPTRFFHTPSSVFSPQHHLQQPSKSVASIMPEESLKPASHFQGDHHLHYSPKFRPASPLNHLNNNKHSPQLELQPPKQPQRVRGRKQIGPWKPQLESISETRPVLHDFSSAFTTSLASILATTTATATTTTTRNYINNFPVPMISGVKAWTGSPYPSPPSSPLHPSMFTGHSYGGGQHYQPQFTQHQQRLGNLLHSPIAGDRDSHRQRFIYSA